MPIAFDTLLAIRFPESKVRAMGRSATGVAGIKLRPKDLVVGMVVVKREGTLLVASEKGYGNAAPSRTMASPTAAAWELLR